MRSFGPMERRTRAFRRLPPRVTDYSKASFEDTTRAFQQLVSAKSAEQAFEIQSQYAKKAYDTYVAQVSKLGEMWVDLARGVYKPIERTISK
jgi:phasin family protein